MQPIAVIGVSCLFPEANTPEDFWKNLLQEKDSCTPATASNMEADPSRFFEEKKVLRINTTVHVVDISVASV